MATKMDEGRREEVCTILLSLLLSRQGPTSVTLLDKEYYDLEKECIPWRKFGYTDLIDFLKSAPHQFLVESRSDGYFVRGIASDKSRHVSSLVARQKSKPAPRMQRSRRPFMTRYIPQQRMRSNTLPPNFLHGLVQYIRNYPDGVSMQRIQEHIQKTVPSITISVSDLRAQLYELSHQLRIDGENIYPQVNNTSQNAKNCKQPPPLTSKPQNASYSAPVEICAGEDEGPEYSEEPDFEYTDEETFIPAGCIPPKPSRLRHNRLAMKFAQNAQFSEQNAHFCHDNSNDFDANMHPNTYENDTINAGTINDDNEHEETLLISERTQLRLKQLLEKYPEGIWCAQLPDKYLAEYKVHLNYIELGFTSVRAYVSYLKDIFYMTQESTTDDFLLFSADKKPRISEDTFKPNPVKEEAISRERHDNYYGACAQFNVDNDDPPIPADVSPNITKRFAPENVMNYNESVGCILVTDLIARKKPLKAYVVEVFNPSFFWIQLAENRKFFLNHFMKELSEFYKFNYDKYTIPKVALKKGLNCAVIYCNLWHRGIIKLVMPDFRVTVLFYDYGTLKTYEPDDVFYLHKRFASLPAQAIPCALYNVRPIVSDRWKRSANNQFIDRIDNNLVNVTIKSINETENTMAVVLTLFEDGDTIINDWLVKEKLAKLGQLVRIPYRNFTFDHYLYCKKKSSAFDTNNGLSLNKARYNEIQSISAEYASAHRLSNAESEDSETKNHYDLRNVPAGKRLLYQMLVQPPRSQNITESQSSCEENRSTTLRPTISQRLKLFDAASSLKASTSRTSSEVNGSFEGNSQYINSDIKVDVESRNNGQNYCGFKMEFGLRDSDDEETTKKDFGEFHSLFGGQGSNEPFDWSVIENEKILSKFSRKSNAAHDNNLDAFIEECENDANAKSESRNERTVSSADQYYFNFACNGEEYYSPEMNIEYNDRNVYQAAVANLRNKMLLHNDKCTQVIVPQRILETLRHGDHFPDALECNAITVKANGSALLSKKMTTRVVANKNGEICETKADLRNNENYDTDLKLASCNDIDNRDNSKNSERDANDSSDFSTTRKGINSKFNAELPHRIKEFDMNLSKSSTINSSGSSEQIPSSSYSTIHNSSTDDIISSTDNDQSKVLREKRLEQRVNMLRNFARSESRAPNRVFNMFKFSKDFDTDNPLPLKNETSASSNALKNDSTRCQSNDFSDEMVESFSTLSSDSTMQQLLSQSLDSTANLAESEQRQLNRSLETDSNVSFDNSKNCQLNATITKSHFLRFLQMLKKTQKTSSHTDLDSDDLSDKECVESNKNCDTENNKLADEPMYDEKSVKSDKSCDTENNKSADESMYDEKSVKSDESCDTENKSADESKCLEIFELPEENANASARSQLSDDIRCFNDIDCDVDSNDGFEVFGDPEEFLQYFTKQN